MNKNMPVKQQQAGFGKGYLALGVVILIAAIVLRFFPDKSPQAISTVFGYFKEMIVILPAVMILMGLFAVWVSQDMVMRYMGKASGIKGIAISLGLGALPTGPLYAAFPLAVMLKNKGAKISNITIFLSAWACIKIPQELVELQFLGFKFMGLRLIVTIIFVIIMGSVIEHILTIKEV